MALSLRLHTLLCQSLPSEALKTRMMREWCHPRRRLSESAVASLLRSRHDGNPPCSSSNPTKQQCPLSILPEDSLFAPFTPSSSSRVLWLCCDGVDVLEEIEPGRGGDKQNNGSPDTIGGDPLADMLVSYWDFMNLYSDCDLQHGYWELNCLADCLANGSYNMDLGVCWFESVALWAEAALVNDRIGVSRPRLVPVV
ncbi:PREDICTED: putative ribonuclease H At1g65750 [Prunus dulcis]|uniref:PREDICTED: putative ribonuclease H At1g65750 n=1 Tax=Prunus dulcis TaxID=3755 RepID=A0A5E4FDI3_PRUDU|nr:PREDICTED: putative ribonuclease H At1g65750 [Prunus dulcis]